MSSLCIGSQELHLSQLQEWDHNLLQEWTAFRSLNYIYFKFWNSRHLVKASRVKVVWIYRRLSTLQLWRVTRGKKWTNRWHVFFTAAFHPEGKRNEPALGTWIDWAFDPLMQWEYMNGVPSFCIQQPICKKKRHSTATYVHNININHLVSIPSDQPMQIYLKVLNAWCSGRLIFVGYKCIAHSLELSCWWGWYWSE